jgi:EAL and modified HD-GYP domain-containing signal transduction protein
MGWLSKVMGRPQAAGAGAAAAGHTPVVDAPPAGRPPLPLMGGARVAPPSVAPMARAGSGLAPDAVLGAAGRAAAMAPVFGVRRPLVASTGAVAAFEFSLPGALQQRLNQRSDPVSLAAYQAALVAAAKPVTETSRRALLRISADVLARPGWAAQVPARAMLLVDDLARVPPETAAALRKAGAHLGVPDGPPADAAPTDFVWMDASTGDIDTLLLSAQRWQELRPRVARLASGLAHVDDVERVLKAGFLLAGGLLDKPAGPLPPKPLNAAAHRICSLMNHLALDHELSVVGEAVRADVALSYRLLRYANSPAIGLARSIDSVEQAVMVLGRNELGRWLAVMLMTAADSRQVSQALQEHALARGRLLELLAQRQGEPMPAALFSLGVLSMMEVLLQCPLATVLAPLRLSEPAMQALLERRGPWADYLELGAALDGTDAARLDAVTARWGGANPVLDLAAQAWAWAQMVSAPVAAPAAAAR